MVMIHGSPGNRSDFDALFEQLGTAFTMYAFDMPGFGDSSKHVPNYGYEAAAEYLHKAVEALGLSDVVIAGFSWGGGVAIAYASSHPERVSELIIIGGVGVPNGFHTGNSVSEVIRYLAAAPILLVYPGALAGGATEVDSGE